MRLSWIHVLVASLLAGGCGMGARPRAAAAPITSERRSGVETSASPPIVAPIRPVPTPQALVPMRSELPLRIAGAADPRIVEVGNTSRARRAPIEDVSPPVTEVLVLWYPAWELDDCEAAKAAQSGHVVEVATGDGRVRHRVFDLDAVVIDRTELPVAVALFPVKTACPTELSELAARRWEPTESPELAAAAMIFDPSSIWVGRTRQVATSLQIEDARRRIDFSPRWSWSHRSTAACPLRHLASSR